MNVKWIRKKNVVSNVCLKPQEWPLNQCGWPDQTSVVERVGSLEVYKIMWEWDNYVLAQSCYQ